MAEMTTATRLVRMGDADLDQLAHAPCAVVVLSRTDCGYCRAYERDVAALVHTGGLTGVTVGLVMLDESGAPRFKRAHPWLAAVDFVPYHLLYRWGRHVDEFATSRASYLRQRAAIAFTDCPTDGPADA